MNTAKTPFTRERRYLVVKLKDAAAYLSPDERDQLERLAAKCGLARIDAGKPPLECVVVESDWPEYEPTWRAIQQRMTPPQPSAWQESGRVMSCWVRCADKMPEPGRKVIAYGKTPNGKDRRLRAEWIPRFHVEDDGEFHGDTDYDEKTGANYWPEGWYESNEYEETHWKIGIPITHWMPLPPPPVDAAAEILGSADPRGAAEPTDYLDALRTVLESAPELNMGNYTEDQVRELNDAMIQAYQIMGNVREFVTMQLAAISTAAIQNTEETKKHRITRESPYWTVAYADTCAAVDREMKHRGEAELLRAAVDAGRSRSEALRLEGRREVRGSR
jgi:hypothetical protein